MIRLRSSCISMLLALTLAGCSNDPLDGDPVFCIVRVDDLDPDAEVGAVLKRLAAGRTDDELKDLRAVCNDQRRPLVHDGEAFAVVHVLHRQIRTDSQLSLTLITPCGSVQREESHIDGVVETSLVGPAGSSCSLTVVATIDNSELRRHSERGTNCEMVAKLCASGDAGAPKEDAGDD